MMKGRQNAASRKGADNKKRIIINNQKIKGDKKL